MRLVDQLEQFVDKYLRDQSISDRDNEAIKEFKSLVREIKKETREPYDTTRKLS